MTFAEYMQGKDAQLTKLARRKVVVARQVRADQAARAEVTTARIKQLQTGMRLHSKHQGRK